MTMPVERAAVDPHSAWPQNTPDSSHVLSMVAAAVVMLGRAEQEGRLRQVDVRELASEQPFCNRNANICAKPQNSFGSPSSNPPVPRSHSPLQCWEQYLRRSW